MPTPTPSSRRLSSDHFCALASSGLRMPIGTDLVLERYRTPLAIGPFSLATLPVETVRAMTRELLARRRGTTHPFILGSECDVLHVPAAGATIRRRVEAMLAEAA